MHILFFSDNFPPEVNAPANRTYEHCRRWVQNGAKVTVITCAPNFPQGKVHKGYKNTLWSKKIMDDITVIRVWTFIAPNSGFFLRIFDHISFMISSFIASLFVKKVDIIVTTSPQFFSNFPGFFLSRMKNIPWFLELRDIWPESIRALGALKNNFLFSILENLELYFYKKAKKVIVVTNSFKTNLVSRGIHEEKIKVITNGVNLDNLAPFDGNSNLKDSLEIQNKFCIGYIGTIGMAHKIDILVDLAKKIELSEYSNVFHVLIIGDGSEKSKLQALIKKENLTNITLLDPIKREVLSEYFSILDVFVVHLKNNDLFRSVIPSKIFESLAMGKPILHGVDGESKEIIIKNNVGLFFTPENVNNLYEKLLELYSNTNLYDELSENCIKTSKLYDRDRLAEKMLKLIQEEFKSANDKN